MMKFNKINIYQRQEAVFEIGQMLQTDNSFKQHFMITPKGEFVEVPVISEAAMMKTDGKVIGMVSGFYDLEKFCPLIRQTLQKSIDEVITFLQGGLTCWEFEVYNDGPIGALLLADNVYPSNSFVFELQRDDTNHRDFSGLYINEIKLIPPYRDIMKDVCQIIMNLKNESIQRRVDVFDLFMEMTFEDHYRGKDYKAEQGLVWAEILAENIIETDSEDDYKYTRHIYSKLSKFYETVRDYDNQLKWLKRCFEFEKVCYAKNDSISTYDARFLFFAAKQLAEAIQFYQPLKLDEFIDECFSFLDELHDRERGYMDYIWPLMAMLEQEIHIQREFKFKTNYNLTEVYIDFITHFCVEKNVNYYRDLLEFIDKEKKYAAEAKKEHVLGVYYERLVFLCETLGDKAPEELVKYKDALLAQFQEES